jgi:hypothetical protein
VGFDDRETEPLVAVGCLSAVCGLAAPVVGPLIGWWWCLLLILPPVVLWAVLERVGGRGDQSPGGASP